MIHGSERVFRNPVLSGSCAFETEAPQNSLMFLEGGGRVLALGSFYKVLLPVATGVFEVLVLHCF